MASQSLPLWVEMEAAAKRARARKPAPKPAPAKEPPRLHVVKEPPRLHVRAELAGFVELVFEGEQAKELRALLADRATSEEILDYLDPWTSGIKIHTEVRVVADPVKNTHMRWAIHEGDPVIVSEVRPGAGPQYHAAGKSRPIVDWRQVQ